MSDAPRPSQRLDKWLWHARVTRTRTLAQKLIEAGKVRVNREVVGASSHAVRAGDVITAVMPTRIRVLNVVGLAEKRGSPALAAETFEDVSPPPPPRVPPKGPRPTKRDRRKMDAARAEGLGVPERDG